MMTIYKSGIQVSETIYRRKFVLYKHGFKKLFTFSNETSADNGHTLRGFIEFVCLPPTVCSDNHKNFKEGLMNQILQNFGIIPTYTESHSPWKNRAELK